MAIEVLQGPVISAGESLSDGLDCTGGRIIKITFPHDWTYADLTFQTSSEATATTMSCAQTGWKCRVRCLPVPA